MKIRLVALAMGASFILAGNAWADPEVLLRCESPVPQGLRYAPSGGWGPFANPDRSVSISREKGKLSVTFDGDRSYTTRLVFALPETGIKTFKVLGQSGLERFEVFANPSSGKPAVRHTISSGDIRITVLDVCPVISPDVVVRKLEDLDKAGKH